MELLCCSPIIAIVSPLHPLAGCRGLTLQDIADQRLAPQGWGPGCDAFIQQLRRLRRTASPLHAIQPASAARELAMEHGFVTLMPAIAVARDLELGRLIRLDVTDLPQDHWDVMMAWRGGKRPNPARDRVLEMARSLALRWKGALQPRPR
jgi:DNA-binding transcriptional LysR family regulator